MSSFSILARHRLLAAGAVVVLAGSAVGVAAAQQAPTPPAQGTQPARPGAQQFLDALARRLGITSDRLQQAITEARTEAGLPAGGGFPFGGKGGDHRRGGPGGVDLTAAAQALSITPEITPEQLRQELPGKSLAQVAQAHGKTANDVATALKNAVNQRIDQAVTAGRLTADQATQQKQQAAQRIDQLVNEVRPQGQPGVPGAGGRGGRGLDATVAAQAIGITVDQLRQEIAGKSPAQVAQAHGKNPSDVATALKNAANQRIDQAVTAGRLTADQATQAKQQAAQQIDQSMNEVRPAQGTPGTRGGPRGPRGGDAPNA
jgi:polyhydroxyalkanoate synthesis regulator phasin